MASGNEYSRAAPIFIIASLHAGAHRGAVGGARCATGLAVELQKRHRSVLESLVPAQTVISRQIRAALVAAAVRGGGWPYIRGKRSRIEPTCWALLALAESSADEDGPWPAFAAPHVAWLASLQQSDGLLRDYADAPPNFTANGLAACVLSSLAKRGARADGSGAVRGPDLPRLVQAIVSVKGIKVDAADARQDNTLQGWPWMPATFSWVEPTCWCVLALKIAGASGTSAANLKARAARIAEADRLIANRTCEAGGWNFGNASVAGQDLRPYVPTTALGLIAMQDRRETPEVARSLAWLRTAPLGERSASALSLAAIALRMYGVGVDEIDRALAGDVDRAERLGSLHALAMMLYALTASSHDVRALRV
jgi:hypothetical protein